MLRYSREIAFAAAQVYAQAAEARGAWDARLESLVVDALLRGEADDSLRSRAAALGWGSHDSAVVVVGQAPDAEPEVVVDDIRRAARAHRLDVLTGVQGDRLVAILGGTTEPVRRHARTWWPSSAPARWWWVPWCPTCWPPGRARPPRSPACSRAPAWPDAPRPVLGRRPAPRAGLAGDELARAPAGGGGLPAPAVHRHRAGRDALGVPRADVVAGGDRPGAVRAPQHGPLPAAAGGRGQRLHPVRPADALTLRLALALGRLADARPERPATEL